MISMGEEEEDEDVERMEEGGRKGSGQAKLWLMGKKNEHVAEHDDAVDDTLRKGTRRTKKTNIFDSKPTLCHVVLRGGPVSLITAKHEALAASAGRPVDDKGPNKKILHPSQDQ